MNRKLDQISRRTIEVSCGKASLSIEAKPPEKQNHSAVVDRKKNGETRAKTTIEANVRSEISSHCFRIYLRFFFVHRRRYQE